MTAFLFSLIFTYFSCLKREDLWILSKGNPSTGFKWTGSDYLRTQRGYWETLCPPLPWGLGTVASSHTVKTVPLGRVCLGQVFWAGSSPFVEMWHKAYFYVIVLTGSVMAAAVVACFNKPQLKRHKHSRFKILGRVGSVLTQEPHFYPSKNVVSFSEQMTFRSSVCFLNTYPMPVCTILNVISFVPYLMGHRWGRKH